MVFQSSVILRVMARLLHFLLSVLTSSMRTRLSLQLEVAALRHQLSLYQVGHRRPRIAMTDRLLWSIVARLWSDWQRALFFVQPRTVALWQKRRFRGYWRRQSQKESSGRPQIAPDLRQLIRRMWQADPTWGSPRIVAELHKLGIEVAKSTVEKYKPRGVSWSTESLLPAFPGVDRHLPALMGHLHRTEAARSALSPASGHKGGAIVQSTPSSSEAR